MWLHLIFLSESRLCDSEGPVINKDVCIMFLCLIWGLSNCLRSAVDALFNFYIRLIMTNLGSVETWYLLAWPVLLQSWWHECQMLYSAPVHQSYISPSVCQTTPWCSSHSSVVCTVCKCCRCFISREFVFVFWRVISCYYIIRSPFVFVLVASIRLVHPSLSVTFHSDLRSACIALTYQWAAPPPPEWLHSFRWKLRSSASSVITTI